MNRKAKVNYGVITLILLALILASFVAGIFIIIKFFPELLPSNIFLSFPKGLSPKDYENMPTDPSCVLSFDKSEACVGEEVTATLSDGSLKSCVIAYNYEDMGWKIYNVEVLDINGIFSATQSADTTGTYVFGAVCGYFEGETFYPECRTNDATIEIIDCDECVDSDGGQNKDMAGHVTLDDLSYYDTCFDDTEVTEYYCDADGNVQSINIDCEYDYVNDKPLETCFETRSGGYCMDVDAGYEEGDIVGSGSGTETTTGDGISKIIELTEGDNPCTLGIRFNVNWMSWNDGKYPAVDGNCFNRNYQDWQSLYVMFQDSTGVRYSNVLNPPPPTGISEDICPVYWSKLYPKWALEIYPAFDELDFDGTCEVKYSYSYEIYNCECP